MNNITKLLFGLSWSAIAGYALVRSAMFFVSYHQNDS